MTLTVGSLFSGVGAMDWGLERAGMRVLWQCENDPEASDTLRDHWSHTPNHGDITKADFREVERVDVVAGGFPCQDISNANTNAVGICGARSGLWSEYVRCLRHVRPRYVLVENVAALLSGGGIQRVLGDLASLGYDAEWECVPAAFVGAPHYRDRVFIVAYPIGVGRQAGEVFPQLSQAAACAESIARLSDWRGRGDFRRAPSGRIRLLPNADIGGMDDRTSDRMVRDGWEGVLRGCGNAVVPQVAELIGGWILEHHARALCEVSDVRRQQLHRREPRAASHVGDQPSAQHDRPYRAAQRRKPP